MCEAAPLRRILLLVQYDGTAFCGWQEQGAERTVQGVLGDAIAQLTGVRSCTRASSRTDAGVHARALPVLFETGSLVPLHGVLLGLNTYLPEDVSVVSAREVGPRFDVRLDVVTKRYIYRLWSDRARSALARLVTWHVHGRLSLEAMRAGALHLVGEHDFSAFRAAGCDAPTSRRRVDAVEVRGELPGLVEIEVTGNAFLRNMVRIIAGTLVEVGLGRRDPAWVAEVLEGLDRRKAGRTAPAKGLTLEEVVYGPEGAREGLRHKLELDGEARSI